MKKLRVQNSNSISLEKHTSTPIVVEKRYNQSLPLNCEFIDCVNKIDMSCSGIQDESKL